MRDDLPTVALSVRQPWAWAIIHAGKDVENRSNGAVRYMDFTRTPRIAIHAAKGMTREEYEAAAEFMDSIGVTCPHAVDLPRGSIIGAVSVVGLVSKSTSKWFFGPRGLILKNPKACAPVPSVGALGLFKWSEADPSIIPAPAQWMRPARPKSKPLDRANLFEATGRDDE
jgi:hypothetical protein